MKTDSSEKNILEKYQTIIEGMDLSVSIGKVQQVNGLSILTDGPGDASVGDLVQVEVNRKEIKDNKATKKGNNFLHCEVVGFQGHNLILMPLDLPVGVFPNAQVRYFGEKLSMPATEDMLGRILDGLGRPLDTKGVLLSKQRLLVDGNPPSPMTRVPIKQVMETGIRSIDGLISIGRGQRIGIFAATGVGKSTLLGMIARNTKADINVICLVGERGREVREFIEKDLQEKGLARSVIFVATGDRSAMEKVYATGLATSAAEFFRDRGYHVNLYIDSITRYVMALREIGIASGEQLGPGGFPPRVWHHLSRLLERTGNIQGASITGFYTILVEADDMTEPVADNSQGILDGHIILSRRLAQKGQYPAIEIVDSVSRVMDNIVTPEHLHSAHYLRRILSAYKENEELIRLGAYAQGSDKDVDEAIDKKERVIAFLQQGINENSQWEDCIARLSKLQEAEELSAY